MAQRTSKALRNELVYAIYPRNHCKAVDGQSAFWTIGQDLDRIVKLGVDIVWLMPIYPIGHMKRKGSLGSPYAISDYKGINEELGDLESFLQLVDAIHEKGMRCILDIVFNHTAPDSVYVNEHPEYYFRNTNGNFGNKVADWEDIIDLDYHNKKLWKAQLDVLEYWVDLGVDGFRCDAASLIPMKFWQQGMATLEKKRPNLLWIAETIHDSFVMDQRKRGLYAATDSEAFQVFDACYDYDTHGWFLSYMNGDISLETLISRKDMQGYIYPDNYVKLRFLENHDMPRIRSMVDGDPLLNWLAFNMFEQGMSLVYAGQEYGRRLLPSLFDKEEGDGLCLPELSELSRQEIHLLKWHQKLVALKKEPIFAEGHYRLYPNLKHGVIVGSYEMNDELIIGIFNVENKHGVIDLNLMGSVLGHKIMDGAYEEIYSGQAVMVCEGKVMLRSKPQLLRVLNERG